MTVSKASLTTLSLALTLILAACPPEVGDCSLERCELWICGEPRPLCPCGELCERPLCSDATVYARDPADGECLELVSVCEVPAGWERFWDREDCASGQRMCRTHDDCGEAQVCDLRSCALDDTGVCVLRPEECPEEGDDVVFDCEGNVYGSDCARLRAGARLGDEVETTSFTCTEGGVWARDPASGACSYFASSCYAPEGWPYFFARPECEGPGCSSSPVWARDPASGECVEYVSDCEVPLGNEFFAHLELCEVADQRCDQAGLLCSEGQICDVQGCGEDAVGACVPHPEGCELSPESAEPPLCGCDDVTYQGDCERLAAGAALAYPGPCEPR